MDHLPAVRRVHEQVPYLIHENELYDKEGFFGFPARQGWDRTSLIETGHIQGRDHRSAASFLQAWLFFGLISEVLGRNVDSSASSQYVRRDVRGREYINTGMLQVELQELGNQLKLLSREEKIQRKMRATLALGEARAFVSKHLAAPSGTISPLASGGMDDPLPILTLSLIVIGEALSWFRDRYLEHGATIPGWDDLGSESWGSSQFLMERMDQEGWRPSSIRFLRKLLRNQVSGLHYASTFPVPSDIFGTRSRVDRGRCTDNTCQVEREEVTSYETLGSKHVEKDCRCEQIGPDMERVILILENSPDSYPVFRLKMHNPSSGGTILEIKTCDENTKYIAISPVMIHGLGDPNTNSLFLCQIRRIQNVLKSIMERMPMHGSGLIPCVFQAARTKPVEGTARLLYH